MKGGAEFLAQRLQPFRPPTGADDLPAFLDEAPRRGLSETRRGAGDEDGTAHDGVSSKFVL